MGGEKGGVDRSRRHAGEDRETRLGNVAGDPSQEAHLIGRACATTRQHDRKRAVTADGRRGDRRRRVGDRHSRGASVPAAVESRRGGSWHERD